MTKEELDSQLFRAERALRAVLLFHSPSPWDAAKCEQWKGITGSDEATARVLCDHVRAVLSEAWGTVANANG